MSLVIINGSPRYKKSNSALLIDHFLMGYRDQGQQSDVPVHYLAIKDKEARMADIVKAENIIIVFPLYCDSMPGIVKEFIEDLSACTFPTPKRIGFIVQSGFPESIHSTYVERYLRKLTSRLKCSYLGTVIKGGVEGIQVQPSFLTNKTFAMFKQLGNEFARTLEFSPTLMQQMAKPYKISRISAWIGGWMSRISYWNVQLKKNGAYKERYAHPFK